MKEINSETDLRNAILQLEIKRADEVKMLKEQFHLAIESVKPINLIKSTFKDAISSRDLKNDILNTSVGLTAGYLSKVAFASVINSPIRKLLGTALMFGVTNVVARNPETIKSLGKGFLRMIRSKSARRVHDIGHDEPRQIAP